MCQQHKFELERRISKRFRDELSVFTNYTHSLRGIQPCSHRIKKQKDAKNKKKQKTTGKRYLQ